MGFTEALGATFGVIGAASFLSNALFCFLLYRKPTLLKKPHNVLLLTLAVVDMMTGVLIFVTPLFAVIEEPPTSGVGGHLFCYLLDNSYTVFVLSKASVLTVMLLALERWFSVIRPFAYKLYFTRRKLLKYLLYIFVLGAVLQIHKAFESKFKNNECVHVPSITGDKAQQTFAICYVIVTFLVPTLITWASFAHIWYRAKTSPSVFGMSEQAQAQQKLLFRMCAITAAVLTGCWLPSQTIYILNKFDLRLYKEVKISLILSMFNSTVNPWIYFLSNKEYRNEFFSLFFLCNKSSQISPETGMPENDKQIEQAMPA